MKKVIILIVLILTACSFVPTSGDIKDVLKNLAKETGDSCYEVKRVTKLNGMSKGSGYEVMFEAVLKIKKETYITRAVHQLGFENIVCKRKYFEDVFLPEGKIKIIGTMIFFSTEQGWQYENYSSEIRNFK